MDHVYMQHGMDMYMQSDILGWVGIQCKVRSTDKQLTKAQIMAEIQKARAFKPALNEFWIFMMNSQNTATQSLVAEIQRMQVLSFTFEFKFWPDVEELLKEEQNLPILCAYHPKFFIDNTILGYSSGKLLSLFIRNTVYQLMFIWVPPYESSDRVDYFREIHYLMDLRTGQSAKMHCGCGSYFDDLAKIGSFSHLERYRIADWLGKESWDTIIPPKLAFSITSLTKKMIGGELKPARPLQSQINFKYYAHKNGTVTSHMCNLCNHPPAIMVQPLGSHLMPQQNCCMKKTIDLIR
jgi:hypothetical protein